MTQCLAGTEGVIVAASRLREGAARRDRSLDAAAAVTSLGTDGFGRSEGRASLRDFFEVDAKHIVARDARASWRATGKVEARWRRRRSGSGINPEKPNPAIS